MQYPIYVVADKHTRGLNIFWIDIDKYFYDTSKVQSIYEDITLLSNFLVNFLKLHQLLVTAVGGCISDSGGFRTF